MSIPKLSKRDVVYISGPMSGRPDLNKVAFCAMETWLNDKVGCTVLNPARHLVKGWSRQKYLRWDAFHLCKSVTAMVMLPGWRHSPGARFEAMVGKSVGIKRFGADLLPLLDPYLLVGLTGFARCGKDTICGMLHDIYGARVVKFADEVKKMAAYDCLQAGADPFTEDSAQKKLIRPILVQYGTAMRQIDADFWIDRLRKDGKLYEADFVVIGDVRYPNEADFIHSHGGIVVSLQRNQNKPANHDEALWIPRCSPDHVLDAGRREWGCDDATKIVVAARIHRTWGS